MGQKARGRRRFRRLGLERLESRLVLDASMLRITEFVASNANGVRDAEGDRPDWVEIFNAGNDLVDLSGMYLTDDDENLKEWQFPAGVSLPGGGYLVVFASNKDVVFPGGEIHTSFALGADGEFLALVDKDGTTIIDQYAPEFPAQLEDISYGRTMQPTGAPTTLLSPGAASKAIVPTSGTLGLTWTQASFNDASWPISGPTGLGYDNNPSPVNYASLIGTPLPSGTATAYIRVKFNMTSLSEIGRLTLRMKYDDGFAAYINGEPVADANAPEILQWDSQTGAARSDAQAIVYEDFDASEAIPHLKLGENVLAIHALNAPTGSDMLIVPELVAQRLSIIEPQQLGHFLMPTPGYGNDSVNVMGYSVEPKYSVPHGFYDMPQMVAISTPTTGAIIVYTTNGSTPQVDANLNVINGTLYVNPLAISSTTTLRARAFKTGFEPSYVEASTYIFVNDVINQSPLGQVPPGFAPPGTNGQELNYGIDPDIINLYGAQAVKNSLKSLSTFSITTDNANLWNPTTGIYVNAANRGNSWERPATIELIYPDGTQGFEVNAGLRIRGGYSRNDFNPKHAFRMFFRAEYGDRKLEYPLFGDEGVDEFDVLDLRTSQNYAWSSEGSTQNTFEREVFGRDLQRELGDPYTRSRYHHLYINGVYWGLFQTQERVEEHFAESYFGGQTEDYDVVVAGNSYTTEMSAGTDVAWRQLFNYAQQLATNPTANADLYWTMQGLNPDGTRNPSLPVLLDVDALINYSLIIFYTGGFDSGLSRFLGDNAPNNWFGVYNRATADEGFQYFIHDNEHSLGTGGTFSIDRTGPFNNGNQNSYNHSNPQYLHQDLIFHPEYRQRFIDKVQEYFFNGGVMTLAASLARLNQRVSESDPAIIAEAARWGDSKANPPHNKGTWQAEINWLRNTYLPQRGNLVLDQLRFDRIYTNFAAPAFSQHGGMVPQGYPLTMSWTTEGTVYYTTDGATDPRAIGGSVNPSAAVQSYGGPINIVGPTTVKARLLTSTGQWSGLVEATFSTIGAGDYDHDGTVNGSDYLVWRSNFGKSMAPGTSADGTGDGMVDAADYLLWRKNLGAAMSAALDGMRTSADNSMTESPSLESSSSSVVDTASNAFVPTLDSHVAALNSTVPSPIRRTVPGSVSQSAQDLLLMADVWSDSFQGKAPIALSHDADGEIVYAADDSIAQNAWDEVFHTLADATEIHLAGACSEALQCQIV
jgi:hypothetical protein